MSGLSVGSVLDPDVLWVAGPLVGLLFLATMTIAVSRIIRGPSILDRMMGSDVLLATLMCGFGAYIAVFGRVDLLPVLLVLGLLGFLGSVSVSRYVSRSGNSTPIIGAADSEHESPADRFPSQPAEAEVGTSSGAAGRLEDLSAPYGPEEELAEAGDDPRPEEGPRPEDRRGPGGPAGDRRDSSHGVGPLFTDDMKEDRS